jgi:anti-sigma regulatory factor (Ser/Thr protein kinase)
MGMPAHQVSPPGDVAQWPHHSFLPLGALPGAVPCARLHTTAVLWEWGMEALAHAAELAVSELVTNAVRASTNAHDARPPGPPTGIPVIGLRLAGDRLRLLVEVSDHDPGPPIPTVVDPERDGGRGLVLVEAVSERWGFYYHRCGLPAAEPGPRSRCAAIPGGAPGAAARSRARQDRLGAVVPGRLAPGSPAGAVILWA